VGHTVAVNELASLIQAGDVVVLSGAGMSTASGIPDYRGPNGAFSRGHKPMTYQQFVKSGEDRRRYWARSHVGWTAFAQAEPNDAHRAVAELELLGSVTGVITQNVDGLHQQAGSRSVIDLHGRLDRVICLDCGGSQDRRELHDRLTAANPSFTAHIDVINPDGDTDISAEELSAFQVVDCQECGGILKPDVVYFGENVPPTRVADSYAWVEGAATLLVLGSSLTVYSGRRFVEHAKRHQRTVVIVNLGSTKCDDIADLRVHADVVDVLPNLTPSCAT
jgi:NAD-dependent SIR2 family protein deacetylase